jgi:hypothetical protein
MSTRDFFDLASRQRCLAEFDLAHSKGLNDLDLFSNRVDEAVTANGDNLDHVLTEDIIALTRAIFRVIREQPELLVPAIEADERLSRCAEDAKDGTTAP